MYLHYQCWNWKMLFTAKAVKLCNLQQFKFSIYLQIPHHVIKISEMLMLLLTKCLTSGISMFNSLLTACMRYLRLSRIACLHLTMYSTAMEYQFSKELTSVSGKASSFWCFRNVWIMFLLWISKSALKLYIQLRNKLGLR